MFGIDTNLDTELSHFLIFLIFEALQKYEKKRIHLRKTEYF